jgi:hypothetical protein
MSREKLLVLKKTLTNLLNKSEIRASNLTAEASILFVKKPAKKLYFYVNYQALNAIIFQDRYSFSSIKETLKGLAKVR